MDYERKKRSLDILRDDTRTHSKVWDKTPLLHWLIIGGLSPDQGEAEREAGVVCAHHHGRHAGSWKKCWVVKPLFLMSIFTWLWIATHSYIKKNTYMFIDWPSTLFHLLANCKHCGVKVTFADVTFGTLTQEEPRREPPGIDEKRKCAAE